MLIKTNIII